MNKVYRVIWNHSLQSFVAVAEFARVKAKNSSKVTAALILSSIASISLADDKPEGVNSNNPASNTADMQQPVEAGSSGALTAPLKKDELLFPLLYSVPTASFGISAMPFAVDTNATVNIIVNGSVVSQTTDSGWNISSFGERRTDGKGISMVDLANPDSIAIGSGAHNQGGGGIVIGSYAKNTESSSGALALGTYATSTGRAAISLGTAAYSAAHAVALGGWSVAEGARSNAIGVLSSTSAADATAIGTSAMASGTRSIALGSSLNIGTKADPTQDSTTNTHASGDDSVAIGANAKASANKALALGLNSSASLENTLAIGANADASAANAVAIGASSIADRADSVSIGSSKAARQLINLAAGTASNDAVNVAQLNPLIDALGGSATLNTRTGEVTGPNYALNSIEASNGNSQTATTTFSSVGAALSSINSSLSTLSNAALRYTDAATKAAIKLGGEQGTTLSNLKDGTLSKESNEAVNGSQLFATNNTVATNSDNITANSEKIATNSTAITTLTNSTVSYVDAATKAAIKLGGEQGTTLSNLKAGTLSKESNEAVNGSQLFATNNTVATNSDNITANTNNIKANTEKIATNSTAITTLTNSTVSYVDAATKATIKLGGEQGTTLSNLKAGTLSKESNEAVNGSQLFATNTEVAKNTKDIASNSSDITSLTSNLTTITNELKSGVVGLVQQDVETKALTVAAATGGTSMSLAGTDGARTLQGVKAGTLSKESNEAVNGSQLFATNTEVAKNTKDIASNSSDITSLTSNLTTITNELKSGVVGLVQQDVETKALTVAAATGGTSMSLAGTDGARTLQGVKAGTLSKESNEAVNGSQLFATNTEVAKNTKDIASNTNNISTLSNKLSTISNELNGGSLGLVQQQSDTLALTVAALTGGDTISFRGSAGNRVLSGVGAGKADEDAVNIGQLKDLFAELGASNTSIDSSSGKISGPKYTIQGISYNLNDSLAALDSNISAMKSTLEKALTYDDNNNNKVTLGNSSTSQMSTAAAASKTPVKISNLADGNVAAGSSDAVNGNQLNSVQTQVTQNSKDIEDIKNKSGIGLIQQDSSTQEVSVGKDKGGKTVSFTGNEGDRRLTGIANGVADNDAATVAQVKEIAVNSSAVASNNSSKRAKAVATGADSSALGGGAQASAANSLALGSNAKASATNAIALGNGSVADRANTVSVGASGAERQITHVARGTAGTDAVNVNQLNEGLAALSDTSNQKFRELGSRMNDMNDKLKAGVASAMAMAALPQPYQANSGMMAMGGSSYNGQSALAIGASKISENGKWVSKVQGSTNTQGDFGVSAGVGYQW